MNDIRTQYITTDGQIFEYYRDAEAHQNDIDGERLKEYRVTLTVYARTTVQATSKEEAYDQAVALWEADEGNFELEVDDVTAD